MQIRLLIKFRKFNKYEERKDSGYYSGMDEKDRATIDVNTNDDLFEQVLTYYHEMTHNVLDFLFRRKRKVKKETDLEKEFTLRERWNKYTAKTNREEIICHKIEVAVKKVLKKEIPPKFYKELFDDDSKRK